MEPHEFHLAPAQQWVVGERFSVFLEGLKERLLSLSPLRPETVRKASHFASLGERMSHGQTLAMEKDFESRPNSEARVERPVSELIRKVVADMIDQLEAVSMEDVRGVARRLDHNFRGWPAELAEWVDKMDYWTCFVLSVIGRGERSNLKELSLGALRDDEWLALSVNLSSNSRVQILSLDPVDDIFLPEVLGEAVRLNCFLKSLYLHPYGFASIRPYLAALTPGLDGADSTSNITIESLGLNFQEFAGDSRIRDVSVVLAAMVSRNTTLTSLTLIGTCFNVTDWLENLIPALKENANLKVLNLKGSVFALQRELEVELIEIEALNEGFRDLLQSRNGGLEDINLQDTALDLYAGQFKEILRMKWAYRGKFQEQARVSLTCGRIVLCGYEHAGKTTLCETMVRSRYGSHDSCFQPWKMVWKRIMIRCPGLRRLLFGSRAAEELTHRTRGVDIVVLRDRPRRTSLWDFAGQTEYYALHDYIFPDVKNSCFLYVCSAILPPGDARVTPSRKAMIKGEQEMKAELVYWMRFIASNSKPVSDPSRLPRVIFVLTYRDRLDEVQLAIATMWAKKVITELGAQFEGRIRLEQTLEVVDAHSPKDVKPVLARVEKSLKELLDLTTEYAVCEHVRNELQEWCAKNPDKPIITMKIFEQEVCTKVRGRAWDEAVKALAEIAHRETVLTYLSETGDVMFSPYLGFIVVNGVLGSLIDAFDYRDKGNRSTAEWARSFTCLHTTKTYGGLVHDKGFVTREHIEKFLNTSLQTVHLTQGICAEDLIKLMIHLELCFEEEPGKHESRIFIPSVFDDKDLTDAKGRRQLRWKLHPPTDADVIHFGRRLECINTSLTFLTPGFFHRAQVRLRNYVHTNNWDNAFQVDKHLLGFGENGVEVLVEYSGHIGYFVDILVKSSKPFAQALEFVQDHVVQKLREFCAEPQGCQGVLLEECVIRPICVKRLDVCEDRRDQAEKVSVLKDKVAADPRYEYCWRMDDQTDYGIDLLEGEGSYRKKYRDATQAAVQTPALLMVEIATNMPRNLYFAADGNWFTSLVSKGDYGPVMSIRLYAKCDYGHHEVDKQPGRLLQIKGRDNIELVKYGANLVGLVVRAGAENFGAGAVGKAVDHFVQKAFSSPLLPVPMETLLKEFVNTGKRASLGDVIRALQVYVQTEDSKRWLSTFFDVDKGDKKFRHDFKLWKARRANQNQVVWACDACYNSGRVSGTLQ